MTVNSQQRQICLRPFNTLCPFTHTTHSPTWSYSCLVDLGSLEQGLHKNCGTGGTCHQGSNWWSPFPKSWATMFPATVAMVSTKTFLRLLKPSLTWLSKGLHRLLSWFWFFRVLYIHISQKDSPPKTPKTTLKPQFLKPLQNSLKPPPFKGRSWPCNSALKSCPNFKKPPLRNSHIKPDTSNLT